MYIYMINVGAFAERNDFKVTFKYLCYLFLSYMQVKHFSETWNTF